MMNFASQPILDDFEVFLINSREQTPLTNDGPDHFHLAYFRHTGQWFQVFEALSLEECLKAIEENSFFWP
jgi:hypothetical protein